MTTHPQERQKARGGSKPAESKQDAVKHSRLVGWVRRLVGLAHVHCWNTTHTNPYMHPTRQKCRCGEVREVEWLDRSMWHSNWIYSDGSKSGRECGPDGPFDWGDHHGFSPQRRLKPNTTDKGA